MTVKLFRPSQQPTIESLEGFSTPRATHFAHMPTQVAILLDCAPNLVDVLANGEGYVVYTVFDSEGEANLEATLAVADVTGSNFDVTNEDELLRGPVLIVKE
ncbi:MAG: hypothetical protein EOO61_00215 [Hymenobacter sp.]|nr:MAG: hypothetical protein EOO61_00215 [Hymenobacter sp.]